MEYPVIRNKPVAKFFYRGTHSHPVKRTVLITENDGELFKGYEVREGGEIRDVNNAPIKSFRRDKIATTKQLRGGSKVGKEESTLVRMSMTQAEKAGW